MTRRRILVLNPGSSSLKAGLIESPRHTLARADARWGSDASRSVDRSKGLASVLDQLGIGSQDAAPDIDAVAYRVVHGGTRLTSPVLIDDAIVNAIEEVRELAPLHNDVALETIAAGRRRLPSLAHVACFDTAFHAGLAPDAFRYPVPEHWYTDWGIRRFGFHGLSVAWSSTRAAELLQQPASSLNLVVAHLGSGCSVTAVREGRSVDTTMGMTPLEGLMMGTRSGSIDPGVPLHLLLSGRLDGIALAEALEHESGLKGVSGRSGDMRTIEAAAESGDARAELAVAMFSHRAAAAIAAMSTALPHLDALVFTGGIGEHSATVRGRIVARLGVLGLAPLLAEMTGAAIDARLSYEGSSPAVLRIEAREDLVIASLAADLLEH